MFRRLRNSVRGREKTRASNRDAKIDDMWKEWFSLKSDLDCHCSDKKKNKNKQLFVNMINSTRKDLQELETKLIKKVGFDKFVLESANKVPDLPAENKRGTSTKTSQSHNAAVAANEVADAYHAPVATGANKPSANNGSVRSPTHSDIACSSSDSTSYRSDSDNRRSATNPAMADCFRDVQPDKLSKRCDAETSDTACYLDGDQVDQCDEEIVKPPPSERTINDESFSKDAVDFQAWEKMGREDFHFPEIPEKVKPMADGTIGTKERRLAAIDTHDPTIAFLLISLLGFLFRSRLHSIAKSFSRNLQPADPQKNRGRLTLTQAELLV